MKILMVCLGNICRSPLAEGIMQHLISEQCVGWEVDSAGTGNWHIGKGPDHRSTAIARKNGIDISKQVCRLFTVSDFEAFDYILVMDRSNLRNVLALAPNERAAQKVKLLLTNYEVPDPYYDDAQFEPVFKLIEDGCRSFIRQVIKSGQ